MGCASSPENILNSALESVHFSTLSVQFIILLTKCTKIDNLQTIMYYIGGAMVGI